MSLNEVLKKAVIESIANTHISALGWYARENNDVLNFLYSKRVIDDVSIERALEDVVLRQAKIDYKRLTGNRNFFPLYPDHLASPECLSYALQKNIFSEKEVGKILFDHGQTAETFPARYGKPTLLSDLRKELLNPKPALKFGEYDPHPTCSCGF